jgi:hypothetical protein
MTLGMGCGGVTCGGRVKVRVVVMVMVRVRVKLKVRARIMVGDRVGVRVIAFRVKIMVKPKVTVNHECCVAPKICQKIIIVGKLYR